jgi:uncharacterized protein
VTPSGNYETGVGEAATADLVETHISLLFFVGERVYKLRKSIDLGFVDFTDRSTRLADCHHEVMLNRRLAPDVYLGVADLRFQGQPVDHMVVMRRLPRERRLSVLARRGVDLGDALGEVAKKLVSFHKAAERSSSISSKASAESVRAGWAANFGEAAPFVGSILDPAVESEIHSRVDQWISGREALLRSRIEARRVCDGHGDLQADDIFCLEDGVRILDCVEFSDELRYGDVAADVAFLAMDLERLGRPAASREFLNLYQKLAEDRFPDSLIHHYCASRAYVRAKVCCIRATQGADEASRLARELHELALSHLRRGQPTVVLVGGLPGSGKTTLANGIGEVLSWQVLHSDDVRRDVFGGSDGAIWTYRSDHYSESAKGAVYEELLRRSKQLLGMGESVILDATWLDGAWRERARAMSANSSSEVVELCCVVPPHEARMRIRLRSSEGTDTSEATPDLVASMTQSPTLWPSATVIDTSHTTLESLDQVFEVLGHGAKTALSSQTSE